MNILFIGAINLNQKPRGGEEFKNQLFMSILSNEFDMVIIDTTNWKRRPWIFFEIIVSILNSKFQRIVVSTSTISAYKLFRFLKSIFPSKLKKIKYFVIGGYLPEGLKSGRLKSEVYQKLGKVVVEGNLLKNQLAQFQIDSLVVPNFKNSPQKRISTEEIKLRSETEQPFRFVFLSRMIEEKGIYDILNAVTIINEKYGTEKLMVDFFGPIDDINLSKFNSLAPDNCKYKGYLDLINSDDDNYKVLSSYQVMLFPTKWYGEGFPGIFLDAFICGIPVICSDINMNSELIVNEKNGLILENWNLDEPMQKLMDNRDLLLKLSFNSYKSFENFNIDVVHNIIETNIKI